MRQRDLIGQIRIFLKLNKIKCFRASELDFLKPSSKNFIWKHSDQNKKLKGNIYFVKKARGLYQLK
jgi:hypothetical protein